MIFKPRIVWWTEAFKETWGKEIVSQIDFSQISSAILWEDPFLNKEGNFIDTLFDNKIKYIIDIVQSLENSNIKWRDRWSIWREERKKHNIDIMTDLQLKWIVMLAENKDIQIKPGYFTWICWEIMERVIGNVPRVKD